MDKQVNVNARMCEISGYTADELLRMTVGDLTHPDDLAHDNELLHAFMSGGAPIYENENLPLQTQERGLRDVEVVANLYDEDGQSVVQCNVRDITERRRAETELREHQHFLDRICEVLPGVLYIFDLDENRTVFVNNASSELDYSTEEIMGMQADVARKLMHPDDQQRFQERIARIRTLNTGETAEIEYRLRDKADKWRWYISTATVFLRDESGVVRQYMAVSSDITDRKRAEFALRESEVRQHQVLQASRIGTFDVDIRSGEAIWNPTEFELLGLQPGEAMPGTATFFVMSTPKI